MMTENEKVSNKEIIDRLVKYFLTQDPRIVAQMMAAHLIDLNRIHHIHKLDESEKNSLLYRIEKNVEQLHKFIQYGPQGDLRVDNLNSTE